MFYPLTDDDRKAIEATPALADLATRIADYFRDANDPPNSDKYVAAANQMGDDISTDEHSICSLGGGGGAYVLAWVWVDDETAGVEAVEAAEG